MKRSMFVSLFDVRLAATRELTSASLPIFRVVVDQDAPVPSLKKSVTSLAPLPFVTDMSMPPAPFRFPVAIKLGCTPVVSVAPVVNPPRPFPRRTVT